jgi:hypothetical protein
MNVAPVAAPRRSSNGLSSQPPRWGRLFWGACGHAFFADKTLRRSGAAIGTSAQKAIHPRWHTPIEATKRLVGAVVVLLSATLVFIPIRQQRRPRLSEALISLAYQEEGGALLSIALLAAIVVLAVATAAVWEMFVGAK